MASTSEFELIHRYCRDIGVQHCSTVVGVGDDAAAISVPEGFELLVSVDTMVVGVHFFADVAPASLAHKLLHINASDIAAMGGLPKWATLAVTLPQYDADWLSEFSNSLNEQATALGIELIGGDTTQGSLSLTLQILGLVKTGHALTRSGAQSGDDVYVSGYPGLAAAGLLIKQGRVKVPAAVDETVFIQALERPTAQLAVSQAIAPFAHACIDVSDGLLADAGHIAKASQVEMELELSALPLTRDYQQIAGTQSVPFALSGGDDYQLCFTCPASAAKSIAVCAQQLQVPLTRIGRVKDSNPDGKVQLLNNGCPLATDSIVSNEGYNHFINE